MKEGLNPATLPPPPGYSQVVKTSGGTTVHIAGQVAWDVDGNVVGPGDFEAQTRQVFANLVEALRAAGAALSDLVRIRIYVVDHNTEKLGVIREVRDEIFGGITPPASTLVGVQALAVGDLLIEIDATAVIAD
jgi:enamine deaminase RidA (YjgF/YER057c/UK114 family)